MAHDQSDASAGSDEMPLPSENKPGTARKAPMYELFVLGELMDGPHYGYLLRDILGRLLGPFRQISWGVLYPLIRHLEGEGLIVLDEQTGTGRSESTRAISNASRIALPRPVADVSLSSCWRPATIRLSILNSFLSN